MKRLLETSNELIDHHLAGVEGGLLRRVAEELGRSAEGRFVFLTCETEGELQFSLVKGAGSGLDLKETGLRICEILDGRGGGSGSVFQGKAGSLSRRTEAVALLRATLRSKS